MYLLHNFDHSVEEFEQHIEDLISQGLNNISCFNSIRMRFAAIRSEMPAVDIDVACYIEDSKVHKLLRKLLNSYSKVKYNSYGKVLEDILHYLHRSEI